MILRHAIARRALRVAATAALGGCAASSSPDAMPTPVGVRIANFDAPYDVHGRTAVEVRRSINTAGVKVLGASYAGELTWLINYRYNTNATGLGSCAVRNLQVDIETRTALPRWVDVDSVDTTLRAQWGAFITALRAHEEGHRRIALEAAAAVRRRLEDLRVNDCSQYGREADDAFKQIIRTFNARDVEYDAATRHGATQGAIWPPMVVRTAPPPG
ncbi:MAG: DUF922 domain-containing protein [Gemmatimonadetes bacterium]|nr:DUF922 domain-containing protein [Gemmatimonadota bacterium]